MFEFPTPASPALEPLPRMRIRSRVFGRERWDVPALLENMRAAAALSMLLESESGVRRVVANELTGRVLVEFTPGELEEPVEALLCKALEFGPMSVSEFRTLRASKPSGLSLLAAVGSAELGCLLLKLLLFSVGCPSMGTAAVMVGFAAASLSHTRSHAKVPRAIPAARIEPDESCGVGNDQNRAQIVQNRRKNRIDGAHRRQIEAN